MSGTEAGKDTRIRRTGYGVFFLSGICAMSSGVVVSLLREQYGLSFARTGTLLSMMSIGNMLAAFLAGWLPGRIGTRAAILILCAGYTLGYGGTALTGAAVLLMAAFFLVGLAKGAALNRCTVMAGMHTENRTRSMQILHSCYACGALLCPFLINALSGAGEKLPLAGLAAAGLAMWLLLAFSGMEGKNGTAEGAAQQRDRSFLRTKNFLAADRHGFLPERGGNRCDGMAGHLLPGAGNSQRCAERIRDDDYVERNPDRPAADCLCASHPEPREGAVRDGSLLYGALCPDDPADGSGSGDHGIVPFLRVHRGSESHVHGNDRQEHESGEHGNPAADCRLRRNPDAGGDRFCRQLVRPADRDADEPGSVPGNYDPGRSDPEK